MSSRENAGSPDVETRMVGIELAIFLQYNWHIYQYLFGGFTYTYGDLLESPQSLIIIIYNLWIFLTVSDQLGQQCCIFLPVCVYK